MWKLASLLLRQRVSQLWIPCTFTQRGAQATLPVPNPSSPCQHPNPCLTIKYKTAPTDLNRHVRDVCDPPKDKLNMASVAMFMTSRVSRDFCAVVRKSLIKSRRRRKPRQSPPDHAGGFDVVTQSHQNICFRDGDVKFRHSHAVLQGIIADPNSAFHHGYEPSPEGFLRGFLSITQHGFGVDPHACCES